MDANARAVSEIVDFRSLIAVPRAGAEPERTLVQVKAVDGLYPLYGSVALAGGGELGAALDPQGGLPGLVAEKVLVDRLGLAPGDVVRLGDPGLPSRRHPRRRARRGHEHAELRPAGDRAARRPRGQRAPRRGLAVRFLLPAAPRPRRRPQRAPRRGARPLRRCRAAVARPAQRPARGRPLRRPAGLVPRPRRARRPRGRRGRDRRGGARASRGEDRDDRDAEDARRHGRHGLRRLPDPDRPSRRPRHPRGPRPRRRCCRSPPPRSSPTGCRCRRSSASTSARWPRPRSTAG